MLEILVYPDGRLKQVADPVTRFDDELRAFIVELEATLRAGPGAVGIAATQVGRGERVAIVDVSSKAVPGHGRLVLVNPEILEWDGFAVGREGCLSVPDFTGNVVRAERIRLEAWDEHGERRELAMEGYEARVAQHELDHLEGILFLDRLVSRRADLFRRKRYLGGGSQTG